MWVVLACTSYSTDLRKHLCLTCFQWKWEELWKKKIIPFNNVAIAISVQKIADIFKNRAALKSTLSWMGDNVADLVLFVCLFVQLWKDTSASINCVTSWEAECRDRDEKQALSCPFRNSAIFHHQLVSCSPFSGQSPQSPGSLLQRGTHPHTQDGGGQDARKSENEWMERFWTYLCNFRRLFLLLYFITVAHFLHHRPKNNLCRPEHLLNLIISKLRDI